MRGTHTIRKRTHDNKETLKLAFSPTRRKKGNWLAKQGNNKQSRQAGKEADITKNK